MAKVYLESGDNFTLSSAATVYGSTGTEKLVINSGVTGVIADANVERVDVAGASSAYTYQQAGNQLQVYSGTTLVATIPVQDDADGTQLVFSNGAVSVKVGAAGMTLGGATVPAAAAAAVTPTTIDATITTGAGSSSGGSSTVGQAFTLTTSTDTPVLTAGNDTITAAAGTLSSSDILSDPSSTDSDVLNLTLSSSLSTTPTIANVEKINADFKGFNLSLAAGSITKGTMVVSTSQEFNDKAQVSGLSSAGGLNFEVGTGIKTLTLSGTTATTSVKLAGGDLTLADTGISTLTLNSTKAANTVTLSDAAVTALTATGDKDLTVVSNFNNLTTDTVTNSLTGGAKLTAKNNATLFAAVDLTKVAASAFDLAADSDTKTVTFAAGTINATFNDVKAGDATFTANGSATTDVLNITANKTMAGTLKTSGYETVNLVDATTAAQSLTSADFTGATLKVSGANDFTFATAVAATNLDASGLTGAAKLSVAGYSIGTASAGTITGAANADSITVADNAGKSITVNAGEGANTVKAAAAANTTVFAVTTGSGNDSIGLGAGADTVVAGAGNDTVDAAGGNDYVVAGDGNDDITTGAGSDYVNAGAGDDIVRLGANYGSGASGDTLLGGDGNDVLVIDAGATTLDANVVGFEALQFSTTSAPTVVTLVDANIAAGSTFTVDFTGFGTTAVTLNASAETDGKLVVTGSNGINTIKTGAGNDTISGGAEADVITAGKGVDVISLGTATTGKIDTVKFVKGDSGSLTALSSGMSTVGFDVVKQGVAGVAAGATKLDLSGISTFASSTAAANLSILADTVTNAPTLSNNKAHLIEGNYNSVTNTFAYSDTGSDMLFVYDTDSSAATAFEGVVLVGVAHTAGLTTNATFASGVLQLQNA